MDTIEPVTGITNGVEKTADALLCHRFLKSMVLKWMEKKTTFFCRCKMGCGECAYNPKKYGVSKSFTVNGTNGWNSREGGLNEELDTSVKDKGTGVDAYKGVEQTGD